VQGNRVELLATAQREYSLREVSPPAECRSFIYVQSDYSTHGVPRQAGFVNGYEKENRMPKLIIAILEPG
jgi:hypothetical protein